MLSFAKYPFHEAPNHGKSVSKKDDKESILNDESL
jgi:hypothetical protein